MMPAPFHTGSRVVRRLLVFVLVIVIAAGGAAFWWLHQPLPMVGNEPLELAIEPGTLPRGVAQDVQAAGVRVDARILYAFFRLSGRGRDIRAGNYEIPPGTTPLALLDKLVRGEETLRTLTLVEGWTFRQVRTALARDEQLKHDTAELSDAALMERLGRPGVHPEGRFFPDTYTRAGLPPTPIAMPGKASLLAAVQPERTKALYFVARGDGSSHFSSSLDEHNRAVNRFQRGQ